MKNAQSTAAVAIAKIAATAVNLFYVVDEQGVLYSAKPKEFAEISKNASLLKKMPTLKHNPTCVFGTGTTRKSFEAARPMVYLQKGKFIQQPIANEPAKVEKSTSGGKVIKVAQSGPGTIYVRLSNTDTRPFSFKPEGFEALQKDTNGIKYASRLKHNPTCVESSLTQGLISTELERPMYELNEKTGKLTQILTPEQAKAVAKVATPKGDASASPKADSKKPETKAERAARKAAELAAKSTTAEQPAADTEVKA